MPKEQQSPFAELTWQNLEEWAGPRIVSRGKSYRQAVRDLRVTADNGLVAWVLGTQKYATGVDIDANGDLSCRCSCPYWTTCKHAVAVVLAYLDSVKRGRVVPAAEADDERLLLLAGELEVDFEEENDEGWDEDEEDREEDDEEDDDELDRAPLSSAGRLTETQGSLRKYLDGLSRNKLTDVLIEVARRVPEAGEIVTDRRRLEGSGRVEGMIQSVRREIEQLSAEPAWSNHWSGGSSIPDYSRVQERLTALLEAGHADAVVELGADVLKLGIKQVEMSDDDGELGEELNACMAVVFDASTRSSMSASERLLWEINAHLRDDYSILDDLKGPLSHGNEYTAADWAKVADELRQRLDKTPGANDKDSTRSFSRDYARRNVMMFLIDALDNAGRNTEVVPLLESELENIACYQELVDRLLAEGRKDEAEKRAREGIRKTAANLPGLASNLRRRLRELAEQSGDLLLTASFRAFEFFDSPGVGAYADLQEAASAAGVWEAVRPRVMHYLETGERPDTADGDPARTAGSWPLPATGTAFPAERKMIRRSFPDTNVLIDIAVHEKRNDDVVKWFYQEEKRPGVWGSSKCDTVAAAVQRSHPDVALDIWRELAEARIAQVKPSTYQVAGTYLARMKILYERESRTEEWQAYLTRLRAANSRRPRMLEVLDSLAGRTKRILDT